MNGFASPGSSMPNFSFRDMSYNRSTYFCGFFEYICVTSLETPTFEEASKTYSNNPTAFHLRAMNMLYEGLKTNATIVVVPSTAIETMQLGAVAGLTALTKQLSNEKSAKPSNDKKI